MAKSIDRRPSKPKSAGAVVSRRHFLRAVGLATAGLLVGACAPEAALEERVTVAPVTPETVTAAPKVATATPMRSSVTPKATSATSRVALPTPAVAGVQPDARLPSRVAIAQAKSYDRDLVRQQVRDVLDKIEGLGDVIGAGDRVAIKVNLTGGTNVQPLPSVAPIDSYVTHPEVVRALGELVRDAGARELFIVEAVYEWDSYKRWGYEEVAKALDARLVDLNDTQPYGDYASTPVGEGWFVYETFTFNLEFR